MWVIGEQPIMAYRKEERERIIRSSYEFYGICEDTIQDSVAEFIEKNPWAEPHANIVFVYIRSLTDYKVISELSGINDIRLRNSLVANITRLHKEVFNYRDPNTEPGSQGNDDMQKFFNPRSRTAG